MSPKLSALRHRLIARAVTQTTFCDACGEVCGPSCRREAALERSRQLIHRNGLIHF